jgi:hypothetical protein
MVDFYTFSGWFLHFSAVNFTTTPLNTFCNEKCRSDWNCDKKVTISAFTNKKVVKFTTFVAEKPTYGFEYYKLRSLDFLTQYDTAWWLTKKTPWKSPWQLSNYHELATLPFTHVSLIFRYRWDFKCLRSKLKKQLMFAFQIFDIHQEN